MRRLAALLLLLASCAHKRALPSPAIYDESGDWIAAETRSLVGADADWGGGGVRAKRAEEAMPMAPPAPPPPGEPAEGAPLASEAPSPDQAARMVHYEGYAKLRSTDPEGVVDAVADLARGLDGRVERLTHTMVSVRVPVDAFEATYAKILALGDVLDRSVRADDVTDQFLAVNLRVRTLKATRDRLVALLAKATDEAEKLALLAQITRVTEALDTVEATLRTLTDLAALSRITVEVQPREAFTGPSGPSLDGFGWLTSITPFDRSTWSERRVALPVPDGLVGLSTKGPFRAESADGTVLWTDRVENDPVGSATFWTTALVDAIGDEFVDLTQREIGAWSCVSLNEAGADTPYRWQVCVQDAGRWLLLAQAFFPGPGQVERYGAAVDRALDEAGGGA